MISPIDVKKLSLLARIELSEEEAERFAKDMSSIISYVDAVKAASGGKKGKKSEVPENLNLKNVLREDGTPRESGIYTEKVLQNAPARQGDYIAVKKVIDRK